MGITELTRNTTKADSRNTVPVAVKWMMLDVAFNGVFCGVISNPTSKFSGKSKWAYVLPFVSGSGTGDWIKVVVPAESTAKLLPLQSKPLLGGSVQEPSSCFAPGS